jgi:hypothetical protein
MLVSVVARPWIDGGRAKIAPSDSPECNKSTPLWEDALFQLDQTLFPARIKVQPTVARQNFTTDISAISFDGSTIIVFPRRTPSAQNKTSHRRIHADCQRIALTHHHTAAAATKAPNVCDSPRCPTVKQTSIKPQPVPRVAPPT